MDNSTNDLREKLADLLDGVLPPEEKTALEKRLETDAELREEWEWLKTARRAVQLYGVQQLVKNSRTVMLQEQVRPVRSLGRHFRLVISAAAAVVLLLSAFFLYRYVNPQTEDMFAAHYVPYKLSSFRGINEPAQEKAYRAGAWPEVIRILETDSAATIRMQFLAGAAAMELKDYRKAVQQFRTVLTRNENEATRGFQDEAEFYLALALQALGDYSGALALLEKIRQDENHLYHDRADVSWIRQVRKRIH